MTTKRSRQTLAPTPNQGDETFAFACPVTIRGSRSCLSSRIGPRIASNNTPHASRRICAPWGVTFLRGRSGALR
nr:hypothetical protein [Thiocapsa sp. KS1]